MKKILTKGIVNKTKKLTILLLVLSLTATAFTGCGEKKQKTDETGKETTEPTELTLAYCSANIQPSEKNLQRVEDAINEHTIRDLDIKVNLVMPSWATYLNGLANEMATGAVDYDVLLTVTALIPTFASYGFLADITDPLQEYGQDLLNSYADPAIATAMNVNGRIYAVPVHKENSTQTTIWLRKDIVDKYAIDTDAIKSFEDLEKVYELVSAREPDMLMLALLNYGTAVGLCVDDFGSNLPMGLVNPTESTEVVSYADTKEFADWCAMLHSWYEKGWIDAGVTTETTDPHDMIASGRAFSSFTSFSHPLAKSDYEAQASGTEMVMVTLGEQIATNSAAAYFGYSVSASTKDVNKSVQLLNYINTNKEVMNLLNWGEEGVDYVVTENGTLDYPEGVSLDTVGYHVDCGWALPNQLICTPWSDMDVDIYDQIADYNDQAVYSKAFGFNFDITNVMNEITAVNQVVDQYYYGLITGALDPEEYIPLLQEALKAAGQDKILEEMQSQLDAFLESQP